jgi:hypothetical protein
MKLYKTLSLHQRINFRFNYAGDTKLKSCLYDLNTFGFDEYKVDDCSMPYHKSMDCNGFYGY